MSNIKESQQTSKLKLVIIISSVIYYLLSLFFGLIGQINHGREVELFELFIMSPISQISFVIYVFIPLILFGIPAVFIKNRIVKILLAAAGSTVTFYLFILMCFVSSTSGMFGD